MLNTLSPGLRLNTGDTGEITHKGKHTTTSATLYSLENRADTWVADTPGLRQVDFWQVDKADIAYCFPEFAPFLAQCRFADCTHHAELGCAVRAAMETGTVDERRYRSFLQLTE